MTARQLESRIQALRASVRRLLALHGICWVVGLLLPLVIAAGLADWLFHLDAGIRAALLAALAGTLGSFADAACKVLPKMAGLRLSESTVERTTEAADKSDNRARERQHRRSDRAKDQCEDDKSG